MYTYLYKFSTELSHCDEEVMQVIYKELGISLLYVVHVYIIHNIIYIQDVHGQVRRLVVYDI